jgi:hypothetical protein
MSSKLKKKKVLYALNWGYMKRDRRNGTNENLFSLQRSELMI